MKASRLPRARNCRRAVPSVRRPGKAFASLPCPNSGDKLGAKLGGNGLSFELCFENLYGSFLIFYLLRSCHVHSSRLSSL